MKTTWWAIVGLAMVAVATSGAWAQRSTPLQVLQPAGLSGDQFGNVVAVDGDTMVVGAPGDDVGSSTDQGTAHVYRWNGSGWAFEATLTAVGGAAADRFGVSVAIAGDTIVVGASQDDVGAAIDQGSAYVFTRSGSAWTQQTRLSAAGGASGDRFGISVGIAGDTAVVGAAEVDVAANVDQGSAYVFVRVGASWSQQAQLKAADGAMGDRFGSALSIAGDTVVVGAPSDKVGPNLSQGSAYVFTRTGGAWSQEARLNVAGGAAWDSLGGSVALAGDTVVVGAKGVDFGWSSDAGAAYVFVRAGGSWTQQARFSAARAWSSAAFGHSVGISGDTVIVGAPFEPVGANPAQGSAVVFKRTGSAWSVQRELTAPAGSPSGNYGFSVAMSGDVAVVGACPDLYGASALQGSACVFSRIGDRWIGPDVSLTPSDGARYDEFGTSVAISGDFAVVGAPNSTGSNRGSAYVFVRSGTSWVLHAAIRPADGTSGDGFGHDVAIVGDTIVVGAPWAYASSGRSGAVYVFVRSGFEWSQQAKLEAFDGEPFDAFGASVDLSATSLIVGAPRESQDPVFYRGAAYVFRRSGASWSVDAKLLAYDGESSDSFGSDVALSGDAAIVGAPEDDAGFSYDQGSAYVFRRSFAGWGTLAKVASPDGRSGDFFGTAVDIDGSTAVVTARRPLSGRGAAHVFKLTDAVPLLQARVAGPEGSVDENFGRSVAISGDTLVVGASAANLGGNVAQGTVYPFTRLGTSWIAQPRLFAATGQADDSLGRSVAIDGSTVFIGAPLVDVGANRDQGSAWAVDVATKDSTIARNDVADTSFATLAAALLSAASGHQITATEGAWRNASILDTAGRSIIFVGRDDIRTPPQSVITLGGSSSMQAPAGAVIDLNGQLRVSTGASADLFADSFRLGSRGILTARTNASLSINAPTAAADGQTRVEQAAALTASGDWTNIGPVSLSQDASFTAGGLLRTIDTWTMSAGARASAGLMIDNLATWTMTAGELYTPLFGNQGSTNVFGASAVFGSFLNATGATTTIRSGTLFVFGDLTNNGTVIGTICSSCSGLPPSMDVGGTLSLGPAANLTMPFVGSTVHVGGSFDCAIDANTRFDLALSTLQMESARPEVTLEVMSRDIGVDAMGLDRSRPGHFPIGELHIGGSPTTVRLVDAYDNALDGTNACEALYVDTLRIDAGSRLINTTCRIYYNTLVNGGTVDVPANLIPLQGTPCPADFNQDGGVDGGDVVDFFVAWEAGESTADVNQDGGVDGGDIDVFFAAWEAGGC